MTNEDRLRELKRQRDFLRSPAFRMEPVQANMDFMDEWFPIQVKQKDKVGRPDVDAFEAVMIREERRLGYFVGFDFTGDALFGDRSVSTERRPGDQAAGR